MESVYYASFDSPIGSLQIASTEKGVCLVLLPGEPPEALLSWVNGHFHGYRLIPDAEFNRAVAAELDEYFAGQRKQFDVRLDLRGTPFQRQVWEELCKIPYGETRSYQEVAKRAGNAKACRAVGMANHANPVPIIVPCHRVIGKDGSLTGYGGGLDLKTRLLRLEGIPA